MNETNKRSKDDQESFDEMDRLLAELEETRKEPKGKKNVMQKKIHKPNFKLSALQEEHMEIIEMEREFDTYLDELISNRLKATIDFGREFSELFLEKYTKELFGNELFFDSLLTIAQQYALSNTPIVRNDGTRIFEMGFHLSIFGAPGTGKTFASKDLILGSPNMNIEPHGLPGKNRYCGGMTAARFVRIGQAYEGKMFNFIITEFNDWFKYKGMIEPLKIALERGTIRYETHSETVGPYKFDSFMSVNYNSNPGGKSRNAAIKDPNFRAIEDRMITRLHVMTNERLSALLENQQKIALGLIKMEYAQKIRDHLTLVYAIQTEHPFVSNMFKPKEIVIDEKPFNSFSSAISNLIEIFKDSTFRISARAQSNAIKLASALSLMSFFSQPEQIEISDDAIRIATKALVSEMWARHS